MPDLGEDEIKRKSKLVKTEGEREGRDRRKLHRINDDNG